MIPETDYFGRVICQKTCSAYFIWVDGDPACSADMRLYPDKWDGVKEKYIPLCRIPKEFSLIRNKEVD